MTLVDYARQLNCDLASAPYSARPATKHATVEAVRQEIEAREALIVALLRKVVAETVEQCARVAENRDRFWENQPGTLRDEIGKRIANKIRSLLRCFADL